MSGIIMLIGMAKWVHIQALELVKCLCTEIRKPTNPYRLQWEKPTLVAAARLGIHEVVEAIVDAFSNEIWSNNEDRNWIFQLAVEYRCKKVFNLIRQRRHMYAFSVPTDASGNNILHIAAKLAPSHTLNHFSCAALQMQSELRWFKNVQMFANLSCIAEKNSSNETPQMVFSREHSELLVEAKTWMKDTATSCMIAASLIATLAFAAALTVPGGNNGNNGPPNFSQHQAFKNFYTSNAGSLFFSVTSLLTFLSILTGRCAEQDFLAVLPHKLICGLYTLFFSMVFMLKSFIITVDGSRDESAIIFWIVLTCLPVHAFICMQLPLLLDVCNVLTEKFFLLKDSMAARTHF